MPKHKIEERGQPPKRPRGFYESILTDWRCTALLVGLTEQEIVLCAAQFCGLSVAALNLSIKGDEDMLNLAERAMRTAHYSRKEVKMGRAVPVVPPTPAG